MHTDLKETYQFLKGAAHLWDRHFERVKQTQLLVLEDLELTIAKNDTHDDVSIRLFISLQQIKM